MKSEKIINNVLRTIKSFSSYVTPEELSCIIKSAISQNGGRGTLNTRCVPPLEMPWFAPYSIESGEAVKNFPTAKKFFYSLQTEYSTQELLTELQKRNIIATSFFGYEGLYGLMDFSISPGGMIYFAPTQN